MKTFELHSHLWIPKMPEDVFPFFADASNLDRLTPSWLDFRILSTLPIEMGEGVEIDYRLRVRRFPIRWRSRITAWEPPDRFVDEQVRGPYRRWVHEHCLRRVNGGTMVEDHVKYAVWGGSIVNRLLVAPDLARIFDFRQSKLAEQFSADSRTAHA